MAEYTKIIRKMRVFEFDIETPAGERFPLITIDRDDGLRDRIEQAFSTTAHSEVRPRNIGLLIDRIRHGLVVTNADNAGYASIEIMRILNQTGFRGELLFMTNGNTYPLHLLRRLNKLALDFDLGTISMSNLLSRVNSTRHSIAQDPSVPSKLTSALG